MAGVNPAHIQKAQEKVFASESQAGEEPPSGIQGAGTADQPYDQGNQPEQAAHPTEEPPSGRQAEGTADRPYDQGNQPEQSSMNIVDELSRTKTKGEIAAKKARRQSQQQGQTPKQPEKSMTNGVPPAISVVDDGRGRNQAEAVTTSTAAKDVDTTKLAPKPRREIERSVSPGQLDDGSHVQCSGEKGQAYTPPTKFDKIKGKLHIGIH